MERNASAIVTVRSDHDLLIEVMNEVKHIGETIRRWEDDGLPICGVQQNRIDNLEDDVDVLKKDLKKWTWVWIAAIIGVIVKSLWPVAATP